MNILNPPYKIEILKEESLLKKNIVEILTILLIIISIYLIFACYLYTKNIMIGIDLYYLKILLIVIITMLLIIFIMSRDLILILLLIKICLLLLLSIIIFFFILINLMSNDGTFKYEILFFYDIIQVIHHYTFEELYDGAIQYCKEKRYILTKEEIEMVVKKHSKFEDIKIELFQKNKKKIESSTILPTFESNGRKILNFMWENSKTIGIMVTGGIIGVTLIKIGYDAYYPGCFRFLFFYVLADIK